MGLFRLGEREVRQLSAEQAQAALARVITARRWRHQAIALSAPLWLAGPLLWIGPRWPLVPALMLSGLLWGLARFDAWHSYRSACVLGAVGHTRDALVGRWVSGDNLGFERGQ